MAALSGLTVSCLATGGASPVGQLQHLPSKTWWQEDFTTGDTTDNYAPGQANEYGPNIFRVYATANSWIAIGQTPDAGVSGARIFLPAESERDYIVQAGDKLDWALDA